MQILNPKPVRAMRGIVRSSGTATAAFSCLTRRFFAVVVLVFLVFALAQLLEVVCVVVS